MKWLRDHKGLAAAIAGGLAVLWYLWYRAAGSNSTSAATAAADTQQPYYDLSAFSSAPPYVPAGTSSTAAPVSLQPLSAVAPTFDLTSLGAPNGNTRANNPAPPVALPSNQTPPPPLPILGPGVRVNANAYQHSLGIGYIVTGDQGQSVDYTPGGQLWAPHL